MRKGKRAKKVIRSIIFFSGPRRRVEMIYFIPRGPSYLVNGFRFELHKSCSITNEKLLGVGSAEMVCLLFVHCVRSCVPVYLFVRFRARVIVTIFVLVYSYSHARVYAIHVIFLQY